MDMTVKDILMTFSTPGCSIKNIRHALTAARKNPRYDLDNSDAMDNHTQWLDASWGQCHCPQTREVKEAMEHNEHALIISLLFFWHTHATDLNYCQHMHKAFIPCDDNPYTAFLRTINPLIYKRYLSAWTATGWFVDKAYTLTFINNHINDYHFEGDADIEFADTDSMSAVLRFLCQIWLINVRASDMCYSDFNDIHTLHVDIRDLYALIFDKKCSQMTQVCIIEHRLTLLCNNVSPTTCDTAAQYLLRLMAINKPVAVHMSVRVRCHREWLHDLPLDVVIKHRTRSAFFRASTDQNLKDDQLSHYTTSLEVMWRGIRSLMSPWSPLLHSIMWCPEGFIADAHNLLLLCKRRVMCIPKDVLYGVLLPMLYDQRRAEFVDRYSHFAHSHKTLMYPKGHKILPSNCQIIEYAFSKNIQPPNIDKFFTDNVDVVDRNAVIIDMILYKQMGMTDALSKLLPDLNDRMTLVEWRRFWKRSHATAEGITFFLRSRGITVKSNMEYEQLIDRLIKDHFANGLTSDHRRLAYSGLHDP